MTVKGAQIRRWRSWLNQFLAILTVNLISITQGIAVAWIAPYLPLLQSLESPLYSGEVSTEDASWIGAFLCVGGLFGCFLYNYIIEKFGKKIGYIFLAFPQMGFWLCVLYGNTAIFLYVARFLLGLTEGGMFIIMPLYVADVSEKEVRGIMGSMYTLVINVGYLIGYIMASYLDYYLMAWIMLPSAFIFIFFMLFIPDTPYCLLRKGKPIEAEKSLMFYRGIDNLSERDPEFRKELEGFIKMVEDENDTSKNTKLTIHDFTNKTARKGLAIGIFLMIISECSGYFAILQYTPTIFIESGSNFTANESTIIVAVLQIFGILLSFFIVDRYGRKILLLISTFGTGLGLTGITVYSYLDSIGINVSAFNWLPVTSLSFAIFIVNIGLVGIPFFITPEILPKKILSVGNVICMVAFNLSAIIVLKAVPIMIESMKIHGTMGTFAGICYFGSLIMLIFLPETRAKDLLAQNQNVEDNNNSNKTETTT